MNRHIETVETKFGPVRKKVSEGYGVYKEKLEYEDLAKIANNENVSISEIRNSIS